MTDYKKSSKIEEHIINGTLDYFEKVYKKDMNAPDN
jgi:hypothetical protein